MFHFYHRCIRFLNRYATYTPEFRKAISRENFIIGAQEYIDYPYILRGDGTSEISGIDCSHLISRALIDSGCMDHHFYRTARYLERLTSPTEIPEIGDLLFLWDDTGEIGHVAIILEQKAGEAYLILDASGPSTGIWSTTIREIDLVGIKHSIGKPIFLL